MTKRKLRVAAGALILVALALIVLVWRMSRSRCGVLWLLRSRC
jgi:hypothetical protein